MIRGNADEFVAESQQSETKPCKEMILSLERH